ncbi:thermonuclease family protein [Labrys wisconsinensis]|uniref:Endonuclease YncB(Thermonuclease family) n=1 Tax=Labrys wisconsinensis TaxID=425677 RepID=A0ABU0JHB2_9HYPH|nr:thermonuclease family protein [Labrys wisconsinensis]MDQ0473675.1 endonuclease YncB(thermonuclease family) [Labrys wisconsinensis]
MKAVRPKFPTVLVRAAALVGLLLLVALVVVVVRGLPESIGPAPGREQPNAADKSDQAAFAPGMAPQRANTAEKADRSDAGKAPRPLLGAFSPVLPPFEVVSADTFKSNDHQFKLAGVEGPPRNAVCVDADGGLWACGLYARAALNNALKDRRVACASARPEPGEEPGAVCTINGGNLAGILVGLGWLRPVDGEQAFVQVMEEARSQKRGMWNGDWHIRS